MAAIRQKYIHTILWHKKILFALCTIILYFILQASIVHSPLLRKFQRYTVAIIQNIRVAR